MKKLSNTSSNLLDQMVKAAESIEQRENRPDFAHQIVRLLDQPKSKTLDEIFQDAVRTANANQEAKLAQELDMPEDHISPEADPFSDNVGLEDPLDDSLSDSLSEEDPGGGDPSSLVNQAIDLLQQAKSALGEPDTEIPGEDPIDQDSLGDPLGEDIDIEEPETSTTNATPQPMPMPYGKPSNHGMTG